MKNETPKDTTTEEPNPSSKSNIISDRIKLAAIIAISMVGIAIAVAIPPLSVFGLIVLFSTAGAGPAGAAGVAGMVMGILAAIAIVVTALAASFKIAGSAMNDIKNAVKNHREKHGNTEQQLEKTEKTPTLETQAPNSLTSSGIKKGSNNSTTPSLANPDNPEKGEASKAVSESLKEVPRKSNQNPSEPSSNNTLGK